jgi:hypothetical protein
VDDKMHDLKAERFYKPPRINGRWVHAKGLFKTFTPPGIKDPAYLHDGCPRTLNNTVEFFNPILGLRLSPQENKALVALTRQL